MECAHCKSTKNITKLCRICKKTPYCDNICAQANWPEHICSRPGQFPRGRVNPEKAALFVNVGQFMIVTQHISAVIFKFGESPKVEYATIHGKLISWDYTANQETVEFHVYAESLKKNMMDAFGQEAFSFSTRTRAQWIVPFRSVFAVNFSSSTIMTNIGQSTILAPERIDPAQYERFQTYFNYEDVDEPQRLKKMEEMILAMWDAPGMPGAQRAMAEWESDSME
jgi:hypothetical protein